MESLRERFRREGIERVDMPMPERLALLEKTKLGGGFNANELLTLASYLDGY